MVSLRKKTQTPTWPLRGPTRWKNNYSTIFPRPTTRTDTAKCLHSISHDDMAAKMPQKDPADWLPPTPSSPRWPTMSCELTPSNLELTTQPTSKDTSAINHRGHGQPIIRRPRYILYVPTFLNRRHINIVRMTSIGTRVLSTTSFSPARYAPEDV